MTFTNKRKGKRGERRISRLLKRWCRKNKAFVLSGIYLPLYDGCCEIDQLVIGRFGVMAVETKTLAGTLEGAPTDKTLTHRVGRNTHAMYNPLLQNRTHTDNISHHLKKAGMGDVPVYGQVVYAGECIPSKSLGLPPEGLIKRLSSLPDAGINAKPLKKFFRKISVRSPVKKFLHRFLTGRKRT